MDTLLNYMSVGYYWTDKELRDIAALPVGFREDEVSICEYVSQEYNVEMSLEEATRLLKVIDNLPKPTKPDKVKLALAAYDAAIVGAESFEEQNIGADLAYLMAAILKGGQCEWPEDRAIIRVLKLRMNKINKLAIFKHIKLA